MWRFLALIGVMAGLAGCGRTRFVVDLGPGGDELTETIVLEDERAGWGAAKVAMVDLRGLIADARRGIVLPGENPVARFAEGLRKAAEDGRVEALLVRINSPGGTVTASDVVYRELMEFRQSTGKPVVVLMGDVAASGGYYVACAADEIVAHPTTITGSIGVVMQTFNFSEGMRKVGIEADAIVSGPNKAMGSPFEPMPPEHRALLQGLVDEFYAAFLGIVKARRPDLPQEDLAWITDGRVVSGRRAGELGLVDRLGGLREAFAAAKERAGISRGRLVKYHRPLEYVGSAYARSPATGQTEINLFQLQVGALPPDQPGFYYLWVPQLRAAEP